MATTWIPTQTESDSIRHDVLHRSLQVLQLALLLAGPVFVTSEVVCSRHDGDTARASQLARPCNGAQRPAAATVEPPNALPLELDLNLPAYRLDAYEGGVRTRQYSVAVGMRKYKTPVGVFAITSVEWNPWWIPPKAAWARNDTVTPPGWSNPMGRVKLNFLPLYFIHGTPFEDSRGRAASHGCVRMANADAMELARYVHGVGFAGFDAATFDSLAADTSLTRRIELTTPVPIRIRYDVAEVADDTLFLYRDVYARDKRSETQRALDALRDEGIEAEQIDQSQLRKLLRSTSRRPARIPLHAVVIGDSSDARSPDHASGNSLGTRPPASTATAERHARVAGGGCPD